MKKQNVATTITCTLEFNGLSLQQQLDTLFKWNVWENYVPILLGNEREVEVITNWQWLCAKDALNEVLNRPEEEKDTEITLTIQIILGNRSWISADQLPGVWLPPAWFVGLCGYF